MNYVSDRRRRGGGGVADHWAVVSAVSCWLHIGSERCKSIVSPSRFSVTEPVSSEHFFPVKNDSCDLTSDCVVGHLKINDIANFQERRI